MCKLDTGAPVVVLAVRWMHAYKVKTHTMQTIEDDYDAEVKELVQTNRK